MINQKEFETFLEENNLRIRTEKNGEISVWTYNEDTSSKLKEIIENEPYKGKIKKGLFLLMGKFFPILKKMPNF